MSTSKEKRDSFQVIRVDDERFSHFLDQLWRQNPLQHPFYQTHTRNWFHEFEPKAQQQADLSFIILFEGVAAFGILLMLYVNASGKRALSCSGKPIVCLENLSFPTKKIYGILKKEFETIFNIQRPDNIIYTDYLFDNQLSYLGKLLMENGAIATPYMTQIIDLLDSEESLHANLRKSFKSLINKGHRELILELLDYKNITHEHIEAYRKLHVDVVGRVTRSKKSWMLQHNMVINKEAFLLFGFLESRLASGVFMLTSPKYCYYGISVSDRSLFDWPLSHTLLWESILKAKALGCEFLELGEQVYVNQANKVPYGVYNDLTRIYPPTEKELMVSRFKHGLGGQTHVRLDIRWSR